MKKNSKLIAYALIAYALLLAGCAQKQQSEPISQICTPLTDKAMLVHTADDILSKMHFTVDKADAEQGVVTTKPLTGAQWFEFWRKDNVGSFNNAEANIQDIRRTVELNVTPQGDKLCVNCIVAVQRFSLPERKVASRSQAYGMFTQSSEIEQRMHLDEKQREAVTWVDLGRDSALETEILNRLETKIAKMQN